MRREQPYGKRYDDADQIEPKHKYFIACEGKKAEYRYFKGLLEARDELGISQLIEVLPIRHGEGTNSHPLTIINEAKEVTDDCDTYFPAVDSVCIIVDRDAKSFTSSQYDKAVALCVEFGFRFIVSNPCMELWLLLHYSDLAQYSSQELLDNKKTGNRTRTEILLKDDYLHGSYSKARLHFRRDFLPHVRTAVENSKQHAQTIDTLKTTIGTNIGLLVEEFLSRHSLLPPTVGLLSNGECHRHPQHVGMIIEITSKPLYSYSYSYSAFGVGRILNQTFWFAMGNPDSSPAPHYTKPSVSCSSSSKDACLSPFPIASSNK